MVVAMSTDQVPWTPPFAWRSTQRSSRCTRRSTATRRNSKTVQCSSSAPATPVVRLRWARPRALDPARRRHQSPRPVSSRPGRRPVRRAAAAVPLPRPPHSHGAHTDGTAPTTEAALGRIAVGARQAPRPRRGRGPARGEITGARDGRPQLADDTTPDVSNVIWCTGYRADYSWIDLPVFVDGRPEHHRGICNASRASTSSACRSSTPCPQASYAVSAATPHSSPATSHSARRHMTRSHPAVARQACSDRKAPAEPARRG